MRLRPSLHYHSWSCPPPFLSFICFLGCPLAYQICCLSISLPPSHHPLLFPVQTAPEQSYLVCAQAGLCQASTYLDTGLPCSQIAVNVFCGMYATLGELVDCTVSLLVNINKYSSLLQLFTMLKEDLRFLPRKDKCHLWLSLRQQFLCKSYEHYRLHFQERISHILCIS